MPAVQISEQPHAGGPGSAPLGAECVPPEHSVAKMPKKRLPKCRKNNCQNAEKGILPNTWYLSESYLFLRSAAL